MSIASKPRLMTAEQFMQADLGEARHELVRGEVVDVTPPPNKQHGFVRSNLAYYLSDYARRTKLGYCLSNDSAVQTTRGPDSVRGADVCWYSESRQPRDQVSSAPNSIVPDLVIEVVSPGNRRGEMLSKVAEYLDAGVLAVWLVYPRERSVVIHRDREIALDVRKEADAIEGQPEWPGFRCTVAELFA